MRNALAWCVVGLFAVGCGGGGNGGTGGGAGGAGGSATGGSGGSTGTGGGVSGTGGGVSGTGGGVSGTGGGVSGTGGGVSGTGGGVSGTGGGAAISLVSLSGRLESATTGAAIANGTVQVVGATPAIQTTTDADGGWTLAVPAATDIFVRGTAPAYKGVQVGMYLTDAGTTTFNLVPNMTFNQVAAVLGLTPNPSAGILNFEFQAAMPLDGGIGAAITLAHGPTFTIGTNGQPRYADAGTADSNGGLPLIFPNVTAGTTDITLLPAPGITCSIPRPMQQRIDADTFTFVRAQCQ